MTDTSDWKPTKREDLVELFADSLDLHESRRAERDAKAKAQGDADKGDKTDDKDKQPPPKKGVLGWLLGE